MAECQIKRCRKCGQAEPDVSFSKNRRECKKCEAARKKNWERENRDRINKRHRDWAEKFPEQAKLIKERWYAKNRSAILAKLKSDYDSDPAAKKARAREYYRRNSETARARTRAWVKANPLRSKSHWVNAKARRKNLPNTWTGDEAAAGLRHWKNSCAACRTPFGLIVAIHWDHWIPIISRECPGTVAGNMIPLCDGCNLTKNSRDAMEWLRDRFGNNADKIARRVADYFESVASSKERSQLCRPNTKKPMRFTAIS